MRQFTFLAPNTFEWRDVPAPKIEADVQAIVRPLAVTRCDLDLYFANGAIPLKDQPFAFGHEIAGEVTEVGDKVTAVKLGDRVIVPFQISCGTCGNCRLGLTNACESVPAYSAYGLAQSCGREWGGGLSDYVLVPYADAMLVRIPDEVTLSAAAAISDNATDGFRTVADPLAKRPGADVLVVGGMAQSVGLFAVQAARALGAGRVVYTDFDAGRLKQAKALGAEVVEMGYADQTVSAGQFPIVVDASNLPNGLIFALKSTAPCGTCTGVSAGVSIMDGLALVKMYMKGITFDIGRAHARAVIDDVLDCARCGHINHDDIITTTVPFSSAQDVIADPDSKIVFVREDGN